MKTLCKSFQHFLLLFFLSATLLLLNATSASPAFADQPTVGLYDLFELQVTNGKSYANPFDFRVIELQADFTAPSGQQYAYFGFYDGDGNGGLTGNVWKLRFMPDEVGTWSYSYTWTDGTPGGSGSFDVVDTGLPGPLRIASDNPWYFEDTRANPFDWRGYSLHLYLHWKYDRGIKPAAAWTDLQQTIKTKVADRGYNVVMLEWPVINKSGWPPSGDNNGNHFWQQNGTNVDFSRYYIPQWQNVEQTLQAAATNRVYVYQFLALVDQYTGRPSDDQMTAYLRYMAARLGPYWNNFGYSAVWEYHDIWSHDEANSVMTRLHDNLSGLPIPPLLSIHDHSNNLFTGWLDFSMRQQQSNDVFDGNIHGGGKQGGVGSNFLNNPIIGSEDIWEMCGSFGDPCNGTEVRRAAWGIQMAGVLPVYLEDTGTTGTFNGQGEPEVRRMWDFFYTKTRYRQYRQFNNLVSSANKQVASGIPGTEYLVYDEDGGSIAIDLSSVAGSKSFSVLWFDPKSGAEQTGGSIAGGAVRTLNSPFSGDSVLLLGAATADATPPTKPSNLAAVAQSESQIQLTWTAASDPESGVDHYKVYRSDVGHIGQTTITSYIDTGLLGGASYSYQVSAVNGEGLESVQSDPAAATTPADATPPALLFADVSGDDLSRIRLMFDETLDSASATNKNNYAINNGISVQKAALEPDGKTVMLTTSPHTGGTTYTITVSNIKDQADNVIAANRQFTYTALYKTFLPVLWQSWPVVGLLIVILLSSTSWFLWLRFRQ